MNESKNVIFPDTKEYDQKLAPEMKAKMDSILSPLGLNSVAIGSAHTPTPGEMSGDLDLQVDMDEIKAKFKTDDDKEAKRALAAFIQDRGFQTRQAGVNVFVRLPVGDDFYQVDLECIPKVAKVSRYHQHKIPKGSPYKGVNKQLMIAALAKSKGYMYSAWQGLFSRTPEGKKDELVADDWDEIAQVLLGPEASGDNLDSVEAIMASLPQDQAQAMLAQLKQDKNWVERPQKESLELDRIKQLAGLNEETNIPPMPDIAGLQPGQTKDLGDGERITLNKDSTVSYSGGFGTVVYNSQGKGIKYILPTFGGLGKTIDLTTNKATTSYNAGPMNIKQGPDGEVDAEYDFGAGKAKMARTSQGATSGTYTPRIESRSLRKDPLKDPLDQMLRIARLK